MPIRKMFILEPFILNYTFFILYDFYSFKRQCTKGINKGFSFCEKPCFVC